MSNELLVIEKLNLELVPFFTKGDRLDELLEAIKVEVMAHVPDASTNKGRTLIKNNITAAKKYRTHLESSGKALSAEYKLIPSAIDATRKKVNEFLLGVEANARESLTEWERIDKIEKKQISDTAAYLIKFDSDLEEGYRDNELFDFKLAKAEADRQAEIKAAEDAATKKAEDKAAEEIAQAGRDKVKAEQATKDAEWLTYITGAYEINAKIDFDRQAAVNKENAAKQVKLNEWIEYISEAYAHNDKLIATKNAQAAEVQRQKDIADQQKRDQANREADKNHKGNVNRTAMEAFIHAGLSQEQAKKAVTAIAKNLIPAVTIRY
jgi:hypothetical protein